MTTVTVLTGPERRRRWTAAEKIRIVEESLAPGAMTSEVARRHNVHRNQLHQWQREARMGILSLREASGERFVPVAVVGGAVAAGESGSGIAASAIEVVLRNGRVLRMPEGVSPGRAASLAAALEGCER